VIGSIEALRSIRPLPELREIDRALGRPYLPSAGLYNSEAWSRRLELPWIVDRIGPPRGLWILDVGSGTSALPVYLARQGARVVSVDPSPPEPRGAADPSRFRAALPHLPFSDRAFDVVCCVSVLEHLAVPLEKSVAEFLRLARRRLLLTFDLALSPFAKLGLSRVELRALETFAGVRAQWPAKPLQATPAERSLTGRGVTVCLVALDVDGEGSSPPRLSGLGRATVRIQRAAQRGLRAASSARGLIASGSARDG